MQTCGRRRVDCHTFKKISGIRQICWQPSYIRWRNIFQYCRRDRNKQLLSSVSTSKNLMNLSMGNVQASQKSCTTYPLENYLLEKFIRKLFIQEIAANKSDEHSLFLKMYDCNLHGYNCMSLHSGRRCKNRYG